MSDEIDLVIGDRRLLLRHLLQDLKDRNVPVELPVGCNDFDDWLLDSLSVPKLLRQVQLKGRLDLINLCTPGERLTPTLVRHRTASVMDEHPPIIQLGGEFRVAVDGGNGRGLPRLNLPAFSSGMDEQTLRELAFVLFLGSCGNSASPGLLQSLRGQLEISTNRGKELGAVVALATKAGISNIVSPEAHTKLLQIIPPSNFQNFRGYVTWREGASTLLLTSMQHAAETSWNASAATATTADTAAGISAHRLLAALKGSLRRLDVRVADDFDEAEHAASAAAVADAAAAITSRCTPAPTLPWGLRSQLAEILLRGMFDSLDEGSLVSEADELSKLLQKGVWPQLGITQEVHQALLAWSHYRQFAASREVALLEGAALMVQRMPSSMPNGGGGQGRQQVSLNGGDQNAVFTSAVLGALGDEAITSLSNYHQSVHNLRELKAMLSLLEAVEGARGRSETIPATLETCIDASVGASLARKASEVAEHAPVEEDRVALLATDVGEMLRAECTEYAPMFLPRQPAARAIAAASLHRHFGAMLLPWLVTVTSLTQSALSTIRASLQLEDELLVETGKMEKKVEPWGTMERVSPLLYTWAQGQITMLQGWVERILAKEDWSGAAARHRGAASRSVVDATKAAGDVLETLFDMGLSIPPGVVRCLVEGVDGVLQKYCDAVLRDIGSADSLIPPAPPMTRYKKDIAAQAELTEMHDSMSGIGGAGGRSPDVGLSKLKNVTSRVGAALAAPWLPPITPEQQARVLQLPYESLTVRANSLHRLVHSMAGLEKLVTERWDAGRPRSSRASDTADATQWMMGMFGGTKAAGVQGADHILHFTAVKLICGDLRSMVFEQLYRFHVEPHRLQPVLESVDAALGSLCETLHEDLAPRLAGHVCKTSAAAVAHVLLDGGPYRLFTLQDVPFLEADLALLQAMFFADGAGLERDVILRLTHPVSEAVEAMSLDTAALIANLKEAKNQPLRTTAQRNGAIDPDVVLRVLCHRAEHAASKFLKKDYKVNKKLPNAVVSSVSRSFASVLGGGSSTAGGGGMRRMAVVTP